MQESTGDENEKPGNGEESYSGGVFSALMQDCPGLAADSNAVIAHVQSPMLLHAAFPLVDGRSLSAEESIQEVCWLPHATKRGTCW